ncbi:MAG: hypothetical protein E6H81_02620 [Chloroflexi bacterium]|nr:MAG: hypothetical protein E6H81_02620 [Chloroflexota bacterium]
MRLVKRFIEKPKREAAEKMVADGGHFWNAGMFVWRVEEVIKAYEQHLPATAKAIGAMVSGTENWSSGDLLAEDANGNYVWAPGKLTALIGVEDLVVVDTPDALLISPKGRSEEVKTIVDRLKREEREDLL